jgi:hypothetical protein
MSDVSAEESAPGLVFRSAPWRNFAVWLTR